MNDPQTDKAHLGWQIYFGVSLFFTVAGTLGVFFIPGLGFFDLIDFIVSVTAFVGLYGFVFHQPIGKVVFWRYFFYGFLAESFVFCLLLPLLNVERYGQPFQLDGFYAFELVYVAIMIRAQHLYAYRRPEIWGQRPAG